MSIKVTVEDTENGERDETVLSPDGYVVVCSGRAYVDHEQVYANGTRIVTVKRRAGAANHG